MLSHYYIWFPIVFAQRNSPVLKSVDWIYIHILFLSSRNIINEVSI